MQTSEFLSLIEPHPTRTIRFIDHVGTPVPPAYHVTEIKSARLQTVDCGGMAHDWKETIFQLWLSKDNEKERAMTAGKVTGIVAQVSRQIEIDPDAELRFEYGCEAYPAAAFHIDRVEQAGEIFTVFLQAPVTACKLEQRNGSCARPEPAAEESCCTSPGCCSS